MTQPLLISGRPTTVDVLVVGSGPVGSAAAAEVVRSNAAARVLIVEVGPALTEEVGRNLKNVDDADERLRLQTLSQGPESHPYGVSSLQDRLRGSDGSIERLARAGTFLLEQDIEPGTSRDWSTAVAMRAASLSSNVGGMGVHWTCASPWPFGAERVPFIADSELDALLDDARSLLQVTHAAYEPNSVGDAVIAGLQVAYPDAPAGRGPNTMPLAVSVASDGRREWTGPATIFEAVGDSADRIQIRPNTLAKSLITDGRSVLGVLVEDRETGDTWEIAAGSVVVAGDSFRTPQLLWASGIRPRALGHYLNDHTQLMGLTAVDLHGAQRPAPVGAEDPLIGVYWMPYSEAHPFHAQIMQFDLSPLALDQEDRAEDSVPTVGLGLFVPKDIRFEDAVRFSDEHLDAYGMPLMSVDYGLTEIDEAALSQAKQYLRRSASAIGYLVGDREPMILEPGSSLHYQGSVRMGAEDDGTSVCDSDSRVWGFDNLFVGGNGVIPTPTAGNPTLTSVALVLRAARRIAERLDNGAV